MSDTSFDSFDFNALTNGEDPFKETKSFEVDERFYTLTKDENGNGQALIIFLPDAEKRLMQQVYKINSNNMVNGKKRFISEFSPTTIGLPDPFQEKWSEYWNAGDKEHARQFARSTRYITNIKIIKDPKKPENNGKIFLYELSQKMRDKLKQALQPTEDDIALGAERKEVYNPFKGYIFKLVARKGANGLINYDSSEFIYKPDLKIYNSAQEAVDDIKNNGYKLSWFLDSKNYKSYDELKKKLDWILNIVPSTETVTVKENTGIEPEVQPSQASQYENNAQESKPLYDDGSHEPSVDVDEAPWESKESKINNVDNLIDDLLK